MASHPNNQRGFSTVEGVLVVIIVGVIGFVGWYVYHTKQNSDTALNAATTTSNNAGPRFGATSQAGNSGSTSDQNLQADLNSANSHVSSSNQSLNATNTSLNDQSTFTSIPQ